MTTPNNSDQAALHDDLRARLPELPEPFGPWHATSDDAGYYTYTADQMRDYAIAALTLPASEAVAWRWMASNKEWNVTSSPAYAARLKDEGRDVKPLYSTPPPSPAAHAGGEAVPVDALREYVVGLKNVVDTADMMGGARTVLRWKIADELTALLSGGAAREEAK